MRRSGDPALLALNRGAKAHRARLRHYLAGRRVIQVRDLAEEAGLGRDYYDAGMIYMELAHAEKILHLGYRPVVVPAMSGALGVLVLVREPWKLDENRAPVHPRLRPYLEDGDALMALLVGRAQRAMELAGTITQESGHGRT